MLIDAHGTLCQYGDMPNNAPITSAEAAAILGVSPMTVRRRVESGDLDFIRKLPGPNGDYLFDEEEVKRLKTAERAAKVKSAVAHVTTVATVVCMVAFFTATSWIF
jgi:excisionase family DNA binding protein